MRLSPLKRKRPPFVVAYKAVIRNPKVSLEAKAVLIILKSYANSDGTHCFPSINRLAKNAGCSRRTIDRHLLELKLHGLIFGEQRQTASGKLSTATYLIYDENHARAAYKPTKSRAGFGARSTSQMAHGEAAKIVPFTEEKRDTA